MAKHVPRVQGLSYAKIEAVSGSILARHSPRTMTGEQPFDVMKYIDGPLEEEYKVDFSVQDLGPAVEGKLENRTLVLNTPVYEGLIQGRPRHRFTGAHEVGHAVLHAGQLAAMQDSAKGAIALFRPNDIPAYENPEWQANAFASSILMPASGVQAIISRNAWIGIPYAAMAIALRFRVSNEAAEIRIKNLLERKMLTM
jgi:hypothetical protein